MSMFVFRTKLAKLDDQESEVTRRVVIVETKEQEQDRDQRRHSHIGSFHRGISMYSFIINSFYLLMLDFI